MSAEIGYVDSHGLVPVDYRVGEGPVFFSGEGAPYPDAGIPRVGGQVNGLGFALFSYNDALRFPVVAYIKSRTVSSVRSFSGSIASDSVRQCIVFENLREVVFLIER